MLSPCTNRATAGKHNHPFELIYLLSWKEQVEVEMMYVLGQCFTPAAFTAYLPLLPLSGAALFPCFKAA